MDLAHTIREAPRCDQGGSNIRYVRMVIAGQEIPEMGGRQFVSHPVASRLSSVYPIFPSRPGLIALAGAGKTFLASKVIDHIQSRLGSSLNQEGFAFFYCNRNEDERRRPLSVLQSYIRQLSIAAGHPGEMHKKLRALWREKTLRGSDLGFDACREQLLESVNLYPKTTLILDALDECDPGSRDRLVETIEFLLSSAKSSLRVFISSRPDADIRDRFISRPNIEIQATDNHEDIKKFVNEEIVKHRRWNKISTQLREQMVHTLLARSEGM
jgi:ankyrin repeat domain-containing protein 50